VYKIEQYPIKYCPKRNGDNYLPELTIELNESLMSVSDSGVEGTVSGFLEIKTLGYCLHSDSL